MEKQHRISLWIGRFSSESELKNRMTESYTEDGDMTSLFLEDFNIDYLDSQFTEVFFYSSMDSKHDILNGFSYAESFIESIPEKNWSEFNSIIIAYNFEYQGDVKKTENLIYVGAFDYEE